MIVYKINVLEELKKAGFNQARIQKEKLLPAQTTQNIKAGKSITLDTLNKVCIMLNMQPGEIIEVIPTEEELEKIGKKGEEKMNNEYIKRVKEKLNESEEWTEEEKQDTELFGFLAMSCYKVIMADFINMNYFNKYVRNLTTKRNSKLVKEFITRESLKLSLDLESDLGKKYSRALVFVLLFPDVKLSNEFAKGCLIAEAEDIFN